MMWASQYAYAWVLISIIGLIGLFYYSFFWEPKGAIGIVGEPNSGQIVSGFIAVIGGIGIGICILRVLVTH